MVRGECVGGEDGERRVRMVRLPHAGYPVVYYDVYGYGLYLRQR